jgi:hypothetical protein
MVLTPPDTGPTGPLTAAEAGHCFRPWPRLSPLECAEWIRWRIRRRIPTSVLRLGDGEFAVLGFGLESPRTATDRALRIWMGDRAGNLDDVAIGRLAEDLRAAVRSADLIGIPRPSRQKGEQECGNIVPIVRHHHLRRCAQVFTDSGLHHFLQMSLSFKLILANLPFLGLITPRDLGPSLEEQFGIATTRRYPVAAERFHFTSPADDVRQTWPDVEPPHYPDRYLELLEELQVPFRGAVFLVGAGAFGKVYCHKIRSLGGIAIDVGSLLDAWAQLSTRKRIHDLMPLFSLAAYDNKASRLHDRRERLRESLVGSYLSNRIYPGEIAFLVSWSRPRLLAAQIVSLLGSTAAPQFRP